MSHCISISSIFSLSIHPSFPLYTSLAAPHSSLEFACDLRLEKMCVDVDMDVGVAAFFTLLISQPTVARCIIRCHSRNKTAFTDSC